MTDAEKLTLLIQFQKWRKDDDDEIEQPHPRDISEALEWAVNILSTVVHMPKEQP